VLSLNGAVTHRNVPDDPGGPTVIVTGSVDLVSPDVELPGSCMLFRKLPTNIISQSCHNFGSVLHLSSGFWVVGPHFARTLSRNEVFLAYDFHDSPRAARMPPDRGAHGLHAGPGFEHQGLSDHQ
jgi:hypothetical protein